MFFKAAALCIALAIVMATTSDAQRPEGADVWHVWTDENAPLGDSIRSIVGDVAARQGNVGLAVAVWHRGELVFAAGQGLADIESRLPVTRDTRFQVASVTKPFTGMVLLRLFERGRIDLDAPIQRYVPQFPSRSGSPITLRYLQAHLGGVRGYRPNERTPNFFLRHYERASDAIAIFMNDSLVAVGTQPIYSSYGYDLIAAAIEGATSMSFPDVLAAEVIRPLGLQRTNTPDARVPILHRARSYTYVAPDKPGSETDTLFRGRDHDYSYNYGGGNLLTTAEDLVRFGRAVLEPRFLSERTRTLLRTPLNEKAIQSFGWVVTRDDRGRTVLFTAGDIEAFQAGLTVWPEQGLVVALTSNTQGKGSGGAELRRDVPRRIGLHVLATQISPEDTASAVKRELEVRYAENEAGFFAKDADRVMRLRHPDFHTIPPDGKVMNREQMYERTRSFIGRIERFDSLSEKITSLTLSGDTAHVMVDQWTTRQQRFPDGTLHEIRTSVTQRESWIRTPQGWLMWRVDQVQPGQTLVDGEPPPPPQPK